MSKSTDTGMGEIAKKKLRKNGNGIWEKRKMKEIK
jgi:hypothetical protein